MNRHPSLARNVLSNWVVLAASITYALFITPVIVRALDKEPYGVWSFLNGLLAYSELLYLGLGSAVVKFIAQFRANNDHAAINRLTSVVVSIYSLLGLACFAVLAGLSPFIPHAFAEPLSPETVSAAGYTCALLGAQMVFIFAGSAFSGLICGHDRYDLVNVVHVASIAFRFVATPLLVRRGHNPLLALAILSVGVSAAQSLAFAGMAFLRVRGLSVRPAWPRRDELTMLYGFGLQSFFIILAVKLISYTDTTVIGVMLGATSVALYSLPLQLVDYARVFVGGFATVFLPRLTVMTTQGDMAGVREAYLNTVRIACFLSGWLVALIVGLGAVFLNRWVGQDFGTPVQWVLVCLALATFGQVLSSQVPLPFYQALDTVSFPAAILMTEAGLNLGLSIWLAPRMGITGVALATAIPALLVSMVLLPPFLCRRLQVPVSTLIVQSIVPGLLMWGAALVTVWSLGLVITTGSYPAIIGRAAATIPIAVLLVHLTFPQDQRQMMWTFLRLRRSVGPDSTAA